MGTNAGAEGADGAGDEELDLQQVKEIAGFLARSPRRHPRIAAVALSVTLLVGVLIAMYWPRSYNCDVRILAQKNLVLPALDNPTRAVPHEADAPTKNAADAILQRDNIVAIAKQLDLVDRWQATRQPILRLKDKLTGWGPPRSDEDRLHDMIDLLGRKLSVGADESSITIAIDWADRELAFEIVSLLQKNFLEARYDTNVNVIVEAIRILEERAKPQAAEVDAALAELTKFEAERAEALKTAAAQVPDPSPAPATVRTTPRAPAPRATAAVPVDPDNAVAVELQDVRRRLRALEDDRQRQISEAQRQLVDARATLGPMHPTVVGLNDKISQLNETPAEIKALDARERELVAQLAGAVAPTPAPAPVNTAPAPAPGGATAPVATAPRYLPRQPVDYRDDSKTALARQKLQIASAKYNELLSRIEAANIELAVTRAAFKYQYTVVRPPELPRVPNKPNVMLVLLVTILASVLLALGIPGALDLMRGRFVEKWQVERSLKLPVLGELAPPP